MINWVNRIFAIRFRYLLITKIEIPFVSASQIFMIYAFPCCAQISERLHQPFDSPFFIDIFIVLDLIFNQFIDHLHAKQFHRCLVICEDIISFLIFCKI